MNEFSGQFGVQLMEIRKKRGITQTQLGELMGMSRQGISHWEKGRSLPDADMLRKLTEILEYDFITGDDLREIAGQPVQVDTSLSVGEKTDEVPQEKLEVPDHASVRPAEEEKGFQLKLRPWMQNLLCAAVGLVAGIMIGANTMPKTIVVEIPQQGNVQHVSAEIPPWEDEAKLAFFPMEDPTRPVIVEDGRPVWFYSAQLEVTNNSMFTVTELTQEMIGLDGQVVDVMHFSPDSIGWGSGELLMGQPFWFNGGSPVQDFSRIEITVHGTDACGETHEAKCQVNLSKEMQ